MTARSSARLHRRCTLARNLLVLIFRHFPHRRGVVDRSSASPRGETGGDRAVYDPRGDGALVARLDALCRPIYAGADAATRVANLFHFTVQSSPAAPAAAPAAAAA